MKGENDMKLTDIIALSKAGYKKADIDKLIEDEKGLLEDTTVDNLPVEEPAEITVETTDSKAEQEKTEEHTEATEKLDYKALYEKAMSDLKLAQDYNNRQNIKTEENEPSVDDILNNLMF